MSNCNYLYFLKSLINSKVNVFKSKYLKIYKEFILHHLFIKELLFIKNIRLLKS